MIRSGCGFNAYREKSFKSTVVTIINTGYINYIFAITLSKMYTYNGMVAGNTMEEAMVQGLAKSTTSLLLFLWPGRNDGYIRIGRWEYT